MPVFPSPSPNNTPARTQKVEKGKSCGDLEAAGDLRVIRFERGYSLRMHAKTGEQVKNIITRTWYGLQPSPTPPGARQKAWVRASVVVNPRRNRYNLKHTLPAFAAFTPFVVVIVPLPRLLCGPTLHDVRWSSPPLGTAFTSDRLTIVPSQSRDDQHNNNKA